MDILRNKPKLNLKLIAIPISSILTILFLTLITSTSKTPKTTHIHIHNHLQNQHFQVAQSYCHDTLYKDLCISTLTLLPDLYKKSMSDAICHVLDVTEAEVRACESQVSGLGYTNGSSLSPIQRRALDDCLELLDGTMDDLNSAYTGVSDGPARHYPDLQTVLSAAMTNQYTCLDGLAIGPDNGALLKVIQPGIFNISHHVSNSLAMLKKTTTSPGGPPYSRDDLETTNKVNKAGYPKWMSKKDRRLLETPTNGTRFDVMVAKDGTGNFATIMEAVAAAPNKTSTRFVIYIKGGAYFEYVEVDKKKTNIMFVGDGIGKTVIKGNHNVYDGYTTFRSATVAVVGKGFIAKGITIENYAGPTKHQAVALRSGSDLSAFYQCSFVGYQDTLYAHSLRQFYRECDIYGTVDFIFGNAAVVFQNCNLYARIPLENQKNMYTAQGRKDPNQNTGISILNCKVAAASDLAANKSAAQTFLGRPWKEYSRTVFMLSYIDDVVDPAGWLEWDGEFALRTLFYGEYMNRGPGSDTSARVTWPGFRVINSSLDASTFDVANFIEGDVWLPSYGIPFYPNLTST